MTRHIAIVGAGYSGTLLAVQLSRLGQRVTLVERAPVAGLGVAYGTTDRRHLLNVRAASMSAFPDDPGHFARWLDARGVADAPACFAPRMVYGEYLRDLLAEARAADPRLALVHGEAVGLIPAGPTGIALSDGTHIAADAVVLATGNLPPGTPPGLDAVTGSSRYRSDPWAGALTEGLGADDAVLLVGTGLTMVDAVVTLAGEGFDGRIVALSRRGQLPHAHAEPGGAADPRTAAPTGPLSQLVADIRRRGDAVGWRAAVDALRPYTQWVWAEASDTDRARFLRHLRPWWDVARHRIAPDIAATVERLRDTDQLEIIAGKLVTASDDGRAITVTWRGRGTGAEERRAFTRVVNCTGPLQNVGRTADPLLASLVATGTIRPDALRIGIDVDAAGRTLDRAGTVNPNLYAVGPMTKGAWWEIVAVPDLRSQMRALAERLAAG